MAPPQQQKDIYYFPGWEEILHNKNSFLTSGTINNDAYSIDSAVVKSWQKSRSSGLFPDQDGKMVYLSPEETSALRHEHEVLIKKVDEIFEALYTRDSIMANAAFGFYLFDAHNHLMLTNGDAMIFKDKHPKQFPIWSEKTLGTSAHILALRQAKTVCIFGPEHYLSAFDKSVVASVPLLNEDGIPYAAISISRHLSDWEQKYEDKNTISLHLCGVANTVAAATESRMRSHFQERQIQKAFASIIEELEQGQIVLNKDKIIQYQNAVAEQLLGLQVGQPIDEAPGDWSELEAAIQGDRDIATNFVIGDEVYRLYVRPFYNKSSATTDIYLVTLKQQSAEDGNKKSDETRPTHKNEVSHTSFCFKDLIGTSKALERAVNKAKTFSYLDESILLLGESGTGKELFAKAIHNDYKPNGPFIAINCAAMPRNLIESELFGYEGGSFTSAERNGRAGKIELAQGGTLFLDEIGDMPIELQAVLLRVLQDKRIMRIGGNQYIDVDFRLIVATNTDIQEQVKQGNFRQDLFYRISALSVTIPPLRDRNSDIELLFRHYMQSYRKKYTRLRNTTFRIHPDVIKAIYHYEWPGNVRELQNAVVHAIATAVDGNITLATLPESITATKAPMIDGDMPPDKIYSIDFLQKILIQNALFSTKNNIAKAANLLGISRSTLYRKLKEFNLEVED